MTHIKSVLKSLHNDERGQGMTEYVIILVAIAVQFGEKIQGLFTISNTALDSVDTNL